MLVRFPGDSVSVRDTGDAVVSVVTFVGHVFVVIVVVVQGPASAAPLNSPLGSEIRRTGV